MSKWMNGNLKEFGIFFFNFQFKNVVLWGEASDNHVVFVIWYSAASLNHLITAMNLVTGTNGLNLSIQVVQNGRSDKNTALGSL